MTRHERVKLTLENGTTVDAVAPVIISASRSTDIPAFHLDWFFNRLNKGYCVWTNPFSQAQSYVSFQNVRCIVFWSKNPRPLIPRLEELKKRGIDCYVQYTLNDYEAEDYEPNVPKLEYRIGTFRELVNKLGRGAVIWRYDPILITNKVGLKEHIGKISRIAQSLRGYVDKMVFSFTDISRYRKVQFNLDQAKIEWKELDVDGMKVFAKEIRHNIILAGIELATCGEAVDLSEFGIKKNKCVDPELMVKLFSNNKPLMECIGYDPMFGTLPATNKDSGQRMDCGCVLSKDIGSYNTCGHGCIYCYANATPAIGRANCEKAQSRREATNLI